MAQASVTRSVKFYRMGRLWSNRACSAFGHHSEANSIDVFNQAFQVIQNGGAISGRGLAGAFQLSGQLTQSGIPISARSSADSVSLRLHVFVVANLGELQHRSPQ